MQSTNIDKYITSSCNNLREEKSEEKQDTDKFKFAEMAHTIKHVNVDRIPVDISTQLVLDKNKTSYTPQRSIASLKMQAHHPYRDQQPESEPLYKHSNNPNKQIAAAITPMRVIGGSVMGPDRMAQAQVDNRLQRDKQHRPVLSSMQSRATPTRISGASTPLQETRFLPGIQPEGRETPSRVWK
jgi:hypothetical protein